jgi:hypothetical protein
MNRPKFVFYRNGREAFDNSSAVAHKGTGRCELCHKKPAESGERFCGACQIKMVRYRARMGDRFDGYL